MARSHIRQALTLFVGLALLGSVIACGGSTGNRIVPAGGTGASGSSAGGGSVSSSDGGHHRDDCDDGRGDDDDDSCTPSATPTPGTTTVTTYQNIRPLALYAGGGFIDFLVAPVPIAQPFVPANTGAMSTDQFTDPITCAPLATPSPQPAAGTKRAALASATPPPTPVPTDLPISNCVIVAYPDTSTTAVAVTGPASIDGDNLIFPATSPGLTYTAGTSYTFFVAIATTTTVPTSGGTPEPCAHKHDRDPHDNRRGRHEDDHGRHKDCGHHYGDDDGGDGGHHHGGHDGGDDH